MKKRILIISAVIVFLALGTVWAIGRNGASSDNRPKHPAKLCNQCGFGNKKDQCVRCGKWIASNDVTARLCDSCSFGSKKDHCAQCGKWIGSANINAKLCGSCSFGSKKRECVQCGKQTD